MSTSAVAALSKKSSEPAALCRTSIAAWSQRISESASGADGARMLAPARARRARIVPPGGEITSARDWSGESEDGVGVAFDAGAVVPGGGTGWAPAAWMQIFLSPKTRNAGTFEVALAAGLQRRLVLDVQRRGLAQVDDAGSWSASSASTETWRRDTSFSLRWAKTRR